MYDYLVGNIEYIGPEYVVLDNNGIGYKLYTPNPYVFKKDSEKIKVYVYQHVREDILALYGFDSREGRDLFIRLLKVSGIGPKSALAILAPGEISQFVNAVENEDEGYLVKFPSVGKKTARQIVLDLKGKLEDLYPTFDIFTEEEAYEQAEAAPHLEEALEALRALGYGEKEIKKVEPHLRKEAMTADKYIKKALQLLLVGVR
ncbi:MAG: Holliday junction branch migration protein RuvA [Bacillaceae bacterium]